MFDFNPTSTNLQFYRRFLENSGQALLKLACLTQVVEEGAGKDEVPQRREYSWQALVDMLRLVHDALREYTITDVTQLEMLDMPYVRKATPDGNSLIIEVGFYSPATAYEKRQCCALLQEEGFLQLRPDDQARLQKSRTPASLASSTSH